MTGRRDANRPRSRSGPAAGWPFGTGEMAELVRRHDWGATPLGPKEAWPQSLRSAADLVLDSPLAMILLWGPELIQLYNDGYRRIMAGKHPSGLGQPTRDCWPEVWDFNAPIYEAVRRGEARSFSEQRLTIERHGAPEAAWFDLAFSPLRDEAGAVAGVLAAVVEVTETVETRRRQRFRGELEERLRPLNDAAETRATAAEALGRQLGADQVIYADIDDAGGFAELARDWNAGTLPDNAGRHPIESFAPAVIDELRHGRTVAIDDVRRDPRCAGAATQAGFERRGIAALLNVPLVKDGRLRAVLAVHGRAPRAWRPAEVALTQETAERTWAAAERARAETALRRSEALLEGIFESAPVGIGVWDPELRFLRVNRRLAEMNGLAPEAHVGRRPDELLPELDDLGPLYDGWRRILETGQPLVGVEVTGATPAEPERTRHWTEHFFPVRIDGSVAAIGGIVEDTTASRQAEAQRALLVAELNHRVKNTLAIVQAVARQTFERSDVPHETRQAFDGRLSALAAAHDLLTRENWEKASLRALAADAAVLCGSAGERILFDGPPLVLEPKQAVSVALALHELCTNAMKYGSLSGSGGGVEMTWRLTDETRPRLALVWREHGGPPVAPPRRRGFGTRMIERVLAQELGGEVAVEFRPQGLVCTVTAPAPGGAAARP